MVAQVASRPAALRMPAAAAPAALEPEPLRAVSLHASVASRLRAMVLEGQLRPGEWIDEKGLAAAWQVSRTPLREALKVLASEGLVELVPQRGCRVIELSEADADALFPVMALLEGRCAFEAASKAGPDERRALQRWHDELEHFAAAGDIDGYYRANHGFHSLVQELAANRWLDRVTADLRRFMRLMRGRQLHLPGRLAASLAEHRALMAAFVAGDAPRAGELMHSHLLKQLEALKRLRRSDRAEARTRAGGAAAPAPAPSPRQPVSPGPTPSSTTARRRTRHAG